MDAKSINDAGYSTLYLARDMTMVLSSSGCRSTSRAERLNSGSSSSNNDN